MGRRRRTAAALFAAALSIAILSIAPAGPGADIGFTGTSRTAVPGETVRVSIGCGFCLPRCVGRPGHRHPPGRSHGTCILGDGPRRPPSGFPVWLTPLDHELGPYPEACREGESCPPGTRPPQAPSFTYLGRAGKAAWKGGIEVPVYALRFRVPPVEPGRYKYVLYCGPCYPGPRGIVIESAVLAHGDLGSGVLRVEPEDGASASADTAGWRPLRSDAGAYSAALPPGWHRAHSRLVPRLVMPREVLSLANFSAVPGQGGECGREPRAAIARMRPGDALISIQEYRVTPPLRSHLTRSFPPLPVRVDRDLFRHSPLRGVGGHPIVAATIPFSDGGRAFDALVYFSGGPVSAQRRMLDAFLGRLRFTARAAARS